ncbi:MAG: endonuclease domain-containing protein [Clostridia bacterium]|nr:endonuclease domain-containing protein [Clostridia bacterium]MBO5338923.1 endonuclease domain-containing protein [Clostridia bacterium]
MSYKYDKKLVHNAQELRKNMTPEERHLWYDFLKKLPLTVNRQKNIGSYIVDFFIASKRIAIEIDGAGHGEEIQFQKDKQRDEELYKIGITVLRYQNNEINKNFNGVCRDILNKLSLSEEYLK